MTLDENYNPAVNNVSTTYLKPDSGQFLSIFWSIYSAVTET